MSHIALKPEEAALTDSNGPSISVLDTTWMVSPDSGYLENRATGLAKNRELDLWGKCFFLGPNFKIDLP